VSAREDVARLIVACPDRPGIIATLSRLLAESGANIISSDQYSTDPEGGRFFLRMEFHLAELATGRAAVEEQLAAVAADFAMDWHLTPAGVRQRVALFASRHDHCVLDLLWRRQRGELDAEIVAVVSNHPDLEKHVLPFGVPYHHVPVVPGRKEAAEERSLDLLAGAVDLVVLARYMQVLSGDFLRRIGTPVINIHHSFLPAFAGPAPYTQAHERGVKLIGATAHYATEDLDEGPIIEQGVARVSHSDTPARLARIGRDLERVVLSHAVQWHLEDRVIVDGNRTIVF
jgi:formyltetrahydrofolate deformylase